MGLEPRSFSPMLVNVSLSSSSCSVSVTSGAGDVASVMAGVRSALAGETSPHGDGGAPMVAGATETAFRTVTRGF